MLNRTLLLGAVAAAMVGAPGIAAAEPPPPPPPPPNVNGYAPVKPSDYSVLGDSAYAFTAAGVTCMVQRSGGYGCNGAIPGTPEPANMASGSIGGVPVFSNVPGNPFASAGEIKALPANSRLSFQTLSCGTDGSITTCLDSRNQAGFVISPGGSWIVGEVNPMVDRPEGTNPYFN